MKAYKNITHELEDAHKVWLERMRKKFSEPIKRPHSFYCKRCGAVEGGLATPNCLKRHPWDIKVPNAKETLKIIQRGL